MATRLQKVLMEKGTHNVCDIKTRAGRLKAEANGAILDLTGTNLEYLDNGAIVMADGYKKNEDGVDMLKVVPYNGSAGKTTYLLATAEEDQLAMFNNVAPQGYRDFFNANNEIVRVFKTRCGDLRYEITNFKLDSSISEVTVGNDVFWDGTNFGYIVGGTAASGIVKVGKVVELEGQFAAGLGLDSIVIDMDV